MAAPKGNQFWKMAKKPTGRPIEFESPEQLEKEANKYFQWCDDNPFEVDKLFHYQGEITRGIEYKMRAYTLKELCLFLGVNEVYFNQFNVKKHLEFSKVIARIRDIIYTQKFTGASAELLNPNIIAMELGLKTRIENEVTKIKPIITKRDE